MASSEIRWTFLKLTLTYFVFIFGAKFKFLQAFEFFKNELKLKNKLILGKYDTVYLCPSA